MGVEEDEDEVAVLAEVKEKEKGLMALAKPGVTGVDPLWEHLSYGIGVPGRGVTGVEGLTSNPAESPPHPPNIFPLPFAPIMPVPNPAGDAPSSCCSTIMEL